MTLAEVVGLALTEGEWEEFRILMRSARGGRLPQPDEARLRYLASKQTPDAQFLRWPDLLETGLLMLGLHSIVRKLS
jgi:hypothetical protein